MLVTRPTPILLIVGANRGQTGRAGRAGMRIGFESRCDPPDSDRSVVRALMADVVAELQSTCGRCQLTGGSFRYLKLVGQIGVGATFERYFGRVDHLDGSLCSQAMLQRDPSWSLMRLPEILQARTGTHTRKQESAASCPCLFFLPAERSTPWSPLFRHKDWRVSHRRQNCEFGYSSCGHSSPPRSSKTNIGGPIGARRWTLDSRL